MIPTANGLYIHLLIWQKCLVSSHVKKQTRNRKRRDWGEKKECLTARESHTDRQAPYSHISLAVIQLCSCWLVGVFIWHGYSFCLIFSNAITERTVCWVWVTLSDGNPAAVVWLCVFKTLSHCYNEKCHHVFSTVLASTKCVSQRLHTWKREKKGLFYQCKVCRLLLYSCMLLSV